MKEAIAAIRALKARQHTALLEGECVRNKLLGHPNSLLEIATSASPQEVKNIFQNDAEPPIRHQTLVRIDGEEILVSSFYKLVYDEGETKVVYIKDFEEYSRHKFVNIDAMFYDPIEKDLIDPFGARLDLESKTLKAVGDTEKLIRYNPGNLWRCITLSSDLGFKMDSDFISKVKVVAAEAKRLPPHETRDNLFLVGNNPYPAEAFETMLESGVMESVIPEVAHTVGCKQDPRSHPEGDVWSHTIGVVRSLVSDEDATALTLFAALLHDVGKVSYYDYVLEQGVKIYANPGHEAYSAVMARNVCKRLELKTDHINRLCKTIKLHEKMHDGKLLVESTVESIIRDSYTDGSLHMLISLQSADAKNSKSTEDLKDFYYSLAEKYTEHKQKGTYTGRSDTEIPYRIGEEMGPADFIRGDICRITNYNQGNRGNTNVSSRYKGTTRQSTIDMISPLNSVILDAYKEAVEEGLIDDTPTNSEDLSDVSEDRGTEYLQESYPAGAD